MELKNQRIGELMQKKVCRFCLTQNENVLNILDTKVNPRLQIQILACVSIEIDDTTPKMICINCKFLMDHFYRFKQICKEADRLLDEFYHSGVLPEEPLKMPDDFIRPKPKGPFLPIKRPATQIASTVNQAPPAKKIKIIEDVQLTAPMEIDPVVLKKAPVVTPKQQVTHPQKVLNVEAKQKPKIIKLTPENLKSFQDKKKVASPVLTQTVIKQEKVSPMKAPKIINGNPEALKKLNLSAPKILNKMSTTSPKQPLNTEIKEVMTNDGTIIQIIQETSNENIPNEELDPVKFAPPVETQVFPCDQCERTFPLKQLLDIHMKNHVRERKHQCDQCEKRFFSKYDLAKHVLTHTGERPHVCVVCGSAFSRSTLLTRHQKIHKDSPKLVCIYCERTFLSEDDLKKHKVNHEKDRPFHCKQCPKSFAYKQGLERHEVSHNKEQPFSCEYCEKSFITTGKLARHLTAHAGERPYPCRLCTKSFMLSHHLSRHIRSHTGGQYKCNDCEEVFNKQDDLIYHSSIHATESLICPLCKEHFEDVEAVTDHIKLHSSSEQHACDYCDLFFLSAEKLEEHCISKHIDVLCSEEIETEDGDIDDNSQKYIIEEIEVNADGKQMAVRTFEASNIKIKTEKVNSQMDYVLDKSASQDEAVEKDEQKMEKQVPKKTFQSKIKDFIHSNESPQPKKKVEEVLKNIPKGLTVVKNNTPKIVQKPTATVTPTSSKPILKKISPPKKLVQQKEIEKVKKIETSPKPSKKELPTPEKVETKTSPKVPAVKTPDTAKTEKKKEDLKTSPTPQTPKPVASTSAATKNDVPYEMKIGNKMVKVKKVILTKAEVAAMKKEGKIEMKDGTMILKQSGR